MKHYIRIVLALFMVCFCEAAYSGTKSKISFSTQCNAFTIMDSTRFSGGPWIQFGTLIDFGDNTPVQNFGQEIDATYHYAKLGTYTVTIVMNLTNAYDYSLSTDTIVTEVTVTCLNQVSVAEKEKNRPSLRLFPNPVNINNVFYVNNPCHEPITFKVFDQKGALVSEYYLDGNSTIEVETISWARGIYTLVADSRRTLRVVVE